MPKHKSLQTTNPGRRARGADQNQSQLQECVHAGERKTDREECIWTGPLEKQEETEWINKYEGESKKEAVWAGASEGRMDKRSALGA